MSSFEWGNGTIYLKAGTGRTRAIYNYLRGLLEVYAMDNVLDRTAYNQALWMLSRVDHVEGDIGFHVPNGDTNAEIVKAFCDNLLDAPEALWNLWDDTAINTRVGGNEDHLLPPDEVPDDKKKPSKKSAANKE